jgi:hypothetical protein
MTFYIIPLLAVFYRCRTFFLTLNKERGLKVLENRVQRKLFWYEKEEVTGAE